MFPLLVNGKIDRQALLKKYEESLASLNFTFSDDELAHYIRPELFAEGRVLLETVAMATAVGGTNKPNLGQRFFEIGGDSLNMVLVLERLNDHGYHVSVTEFIVSGSLAEVAESMQTVDKTPTVDLESALRRLKDKGSYTSGPLKVTKNLKYLKSLEAIISSLSPLFLGNKGNTYIVMGMILYRHSKNRV